MRRATTWALRKSVCVKATRIAPSSSRQAKSILRISRVTSRAASRLARASSGPSNEKRAIDSAMAAVGGFRHCLGQDRARSIARQQSGLRIEHAVGVERLQHALEPRLEGVHAHQRHHARDQPRRIAVDVIDIRQHLGEFGRRFADHRDRNVAEAGVLRQHREEGLDHARRKPVADHDAVDVARIEMPGGGLDAERAEHLDALAHGDAQRGIERPAPRDQHGRVVERIADRQRRQRAAMRGEHFDAA